MVKKNPNNYIDHEIKVKVIESILSQDREWQWFIEYIEGNFELNDVNTWVEFLNLYGNISSVYSYFIKICEIEIMELEVKSNLLTDLILVSKYYIGRVNHEECIGNIRTEFGKVFFFIVWITKLLNLKNEYEYILNYEILTEKNYWQLADITLLTENSYMLLDYSSNIKINGWKVLEKCLQDNLDNISYCYSEDFFEKNKMKFYRADAFSFQSIQSELNNTWEENYLLDMLKVSFDKKRITPMYISGRTKIPDQANWTEKRINHMINFFSNQIATFVLETIRYMIYGTTPSAKTILDHCELLTKYSLKNKNSKTFMISSFKVISYLFADKKMKDVLKEKTYIDMLKEFQGITDPTLISRLQDSDFPISKEQRDLVKSNAVLLYKTIDSIATLNDLIDYLKKREIPRYIDNEYLQKVHGKFLKLIQTDNGLVVASVFYEYMMFLFDVNKKSIDINRNIVREAMIQIQELWQAEYYSKQIQNMSIMRYESTHQIEEVEKYNILALERPIEIARITMLTDENDLCNLMAFISENSLMYFFTRIEISEIFPIEAGVKSFDEHEVYSLLKKKIEKIIEDKGYKFLNVLESDKYVLGVLDRYSQSVQSAMAMIVEDIKLYNHVSDIFDDILISYDGNPKLAHVTQLFPLLETKIRELAKLTGFVPFKIQEDNFMNYRDPSSILREIIQTIFEETNSFEIIPDILFVYNSMYSGNSLNIRNECIHGRNFNSGTGLAFALKTTLMSISMIEYRINIVKENSY